MIHIRVVGRDKCGKSSKARELLREHEEAGRHVVLIDQDVVNSRQDARMTKCDVLITVHKADSNLTVVTTP